MSMERLVPASFVDKLAIDSITGDSIKLNEYAPGAEQGASGIRLLTAGSATLKFKCGGVPKGGNTLPGGTYNSTTGFVERVFGNQGEELGGVQIIEIDKAGSTAGSQWEVFF